MSNIKFEVRTAERKQAKLRIGIAAPSGAGKTYGALLMARGMVDSWEEICLIDTEHGSGELYSHLGPYKTISLTEKMGYQPDNYVGAIKAAEDAGCKVIIIDSLSHAWNGEGGLLDQLDKRKGQGSSFNLWAELTPQHNKLVNTLLGSEAHIIATMRSKQTYELEEYSDAKGNKKNRPVKMGLQPVQREGMEYEFTVFFDTSINHFTEASKDRTGLFAKKPPFEISQETGEILREWNQSGKVDYTHVKNTIAKHLKTIAEAQLTKWPLSYPEFENRVKQLTQLDLAEENYEAIAAALGPIASDWKDNPRDPNEMPEAPTVPEPPKDNPAPQQPETNEQDGVDPTPEAEPEIQADAPEVEEAPAQPEPAQAEAEAPKTTTESPAPEKPAEAKNEPPKATPSKPEQATGANEVDTSSQNEGEAVDEELPPSPWDDKK